MSQLRSTHFTLLMKPNAPESLEALEEGFSFKAFLFTCFWFAYHRLWSLALLVLALTTLIEWAGSKAIISSSVSYILSLLLMVGCGIFARDLHILLLRLRGYQWQGIVIADNTTLAQQAFLERYFAAQSNEASS